MPRNWNTGTPTVRAATTTDILDGPSARMSEALPHRSEVLVIGAGVIGLSVAYALRSRGRDVLVVDRGSIGGGASHGNCGTLTPSHALPLAQPGMVTKAIKWMLHRDAPFYVRPRLDPGLMAWLLKFAGRCNETRVREVARDKARILLDSAQRLRQWIANEGLECEYRHAGLLSVYRDFKTFDQARVNESLLHEVGIRVEAKSGAEAKRMEPALNDGIVAAHWYPQDAELRPERYVAALAGRLRQLGVSIVEHCAVDGWLSSSQGITGIRVGAQTVQADATVLATGALAPQLARRVGIKLPIQPGKGYSITYSRPQMAPRLPLVLRERAVCVTTWGSGYRLGSTMEFSGFSESLNATRLEALRRGAREYLHEPLGPSEIESWYGFRPMTYDDLPIIGAAPRVAGLWLACGHGMLGMSMSAATGELLAQLISDTSTDLDPRPYSPQRF